MTLAVACGGVGTEIVAVVVPVHPRNDVTVMVYVPAGRPVILVPDPLPDPEGLVRLQLYVYGPMAPDTFKAMDPLDVTQDVSWVTSLETVSGHIEKFILLVCVTVFSYPSFAVAETIISPGEFGTVPTNS